MSPFAATSPHTPCHFVTSPFPLSTVERGEGESWGRGGRDAASPSAGQRVPRNAPRHAKGRWYLNGVSDKNKALMQSAPGLH